MPSHDLPAFLPSGLPGAAFRGLALALVICCATPARVAAQVTYFPSPPTVDQLREALLPPTARPPAAPGTASSGDRPGGSRTRGIIIEPVGRPGVPPAASPGATPGGSSGTPIGATPAVRYGTTPSATATAILAGRVPGAAPASTVDRAAALPINFELGSSRVDRGSLPYIERLASLMHDDPGLQLVIEGHTDDRGSFTRNMVLSWDRAIGVYRSLVESYGVDPTRLQLLGKGPLEPLPGSVPSDAANRRVQFRIKG